MQTYVAKLSRRTGSTAHASWFSFAVSSGGFLGPLLTGILWDWKGPFAGFAVTTFWAVMYWAMSRLMPDEPTVALV